jgi:hypothetical protein
MRGRGAEWTYRLSPPEIVEIETAVKAVQSRGLDIADIRREGFPLPTLGPETLRLYTSDCRQHVWRLARKKPKPLGIEMLKYRIFACLLTLSAIATTPAAFAQTAPDYVAIVADPDRSEADRKLDTNRAPAQWLAFIGAKPGMIMRKTRKPSLHASRIGSMRGSKPQQPPISSRWCGQWRILRPRVCMISIS